MTSDLVAPTARAARLPVVAAGPAAGLGLLALLSLVADPLAPLLVLVGLLTAAPAGYLLDDPAADLLAASPTTLARRRLLRLALGVPVLATGWLVAVERGSFLVGYDTLPLGALTVEVAAFACFTLAAAAVAAGRGDRSPGLTASLSLVVLVALLFVARQAFPPSWPLPELQPNLHHRRWWAVTATSLVAFVWASLDPARRRFRSTWPRRSG